MKKRLFIAIMIAIAFISAGCSTISNDLGKIKANLTNEVANALCYSGGKLVYNTLTQGKVTVSGDMATFYDSEGNMVEAFADCIYIYGDVKKAPAFP